MIAKYPNIIKNIHIAIQSGDDGILRKMNRWTDLDKYYELCQYIRKKIIDVTITTDFIVGFPNETNKQFRNTLKLYKKIKFDHSFVAIFSPRFGTEAAKMVDKIKLKVKEKRFNRLNKYVKKYGKINNKKYIGRIMEVMVDGQSKIKNNMLTGRTIN
ncbi:radical SAM protein [bacterium]|nr:radical SAM protein [bacterium]